MAEIINVKFSSNPSPEIISTGNDYEIAKKRSLRADPITDVDIVAEISESFLSRGKFRDNLLFVLGCNCGLRCGEIVSLRWGHLLNRDGSCKKVLEFVEQKTSKKDKTNNRIIKPKSRSVDMGEIVHEAIRLHLNNQAVLDLNAFVFQSEAPTKSYYSEKRKEKNSEDHLSVRSVDKILKKTVNEILGYNDIHASTHIMRKTFARFVFDNAPDSRSAIKFLQAVLGHASVDSTLHYIGVSEEEMREVVTGLNLGRRNNANASKKMTMKIM